MVSFIREIKKLITSRASNHEPDILLILTTGSIVLFGLIMLSITTSASAYYQHGSSYYFFKHQLIGLAMGIAGFIFFSRVDYHTWKKFAFWFLIASVGMLLLVFIPGLSAVHGKARSWINIFGFSLQPSEFVKISFLLYLSAWLEKRRFQLKEVSRGIGPFLGVLGIIAVLMLMQPDFGTLSIIIFTSLVIYYVGGGSKKYVLAIIFTGILLLMIMIKIKPYQADRFRCFWNPSYSSSDKCYQLNQSLIAIGSGGFWGRGLGQSRQKFMYVPEVEGDAIFSIISEEIGFIFSSAVVMAYLFLFYRGYLISKHAPDDFGKILAIGIVTWIVSQAMINIGGMINLMPMTGVPLPFISYGGSAMLAALSAIGILVNISKHTRTHNT